MFHAKDQDRTIGRAVAGRAQHGLSDAALKRLFLWPTLALLIAFNIFPLLYSLYLSFTDYSAIATRPPTWVGLQNYRDILNDTQLWTYFRNTGKYVVLSVALETLVGFGLALLLRRKFWGSGIITTLILIPMMCSPVVVGLFWKMMYNPGYGIFNYLLGFPAGRGPDWLSSPQLALWAVVIVDVWMWAPYVMLLCLAGLSAIPDYLYEAAEIDRASGLYTFWRITLPQVAPLLLIAVLFRTIEAFKTFDLVMGLTGGGPGDSTELVAVDLYRLAFLGQFNTGKSSALAYIVLVIITGVSNIYVRYLNKLKEG
jgi:multiple sugar transport system permease protein